MKFTFAKIKYCANNLNENKSQNNKTSISFNKIFFNENLFITFNYINIRRIN